MGCVLAGFSPPATEAVAQDGSVTALAREIFSTQVFTFELLGALLVIAVMGAMVLEIVLGMVVFMVSSVRWCVVWDLCRGGW